MNLPFIYILLASTNVTDLTTEDTCVFIFYPKKWYIKIMPFFFCSVYIVHCYNNHSVLAKKKKALDKTKLKWFVT
jgi:hypothetical protein